MNIGLGKYQILLLFGLRCPCIADGSLLPLLVQVIFHPDNPRRCVWIQISKCIHPTV